MDTAHREGAPPRSGVRRTPAVRFALGAGVAYAAVGIVGFGLTGFEAPLRTSGPLLLGLEVNPLHNLIHLLVGIGLIGGGSAGAEVSRVLASLTAVAFGVGGLFGLALVGTDGNVLALNHADNVVHLATAALAAVCATASRPDARRL